MEKELEREIKNSAGDEVINLEKELGHLKCKEQAVKPHFTLNLEDAESTRMQRVLNVCRREFKEVKTDYDVAQGYLAEEKKLKVKIKELMLENERLAIRKLYKKRELAELDLAISLLQREILTIQKNAHDVLYDFDRQERAEYRLNKMEKKLETILRKFDNLCAENNEMRKEVIALLYQRELFNKQWEHTIKLLQKSKFYMKEIMNQLQFVTDARDAMVQKLVLLNYDGQMRLESHIKDIAYYSMTLDDLYKLHDFFRIKNSIRLTDEEEIAVRQREKEQREYNELINYREKELNKMFEITKTENVVQLIREYWKREFEIISVFKVVCEIKNESIDIGFDVQKLKKDIKRELYEKLEKRDREAKEIDELSEQLVALKEKNKFLKVMVAEAGLDCYQICKGVQELVDMTQVNKSPLLQLLGRQDKVKPVNCIRYIELVSNYVQEKFKSVYMEQENSYRFLRRKKAAPKQVATEVPQAVRIDKVQSEPTKPKEPVDSLKERKSRSVRRARVQQVQQKSVVQRRHSAPNLSVTPQHRLQAPLVREKRSQSEGRQVDPIVLSLPEYKFISPIPQDQLVTYIPCVYCLEELEFSKPWLMLSPINSQQAVDILRTPPYNTIYGIQSATDIKRLHTERLLNREN